MTLSTTATELPRLMHCIGSHQMARALPPDLDMESRDEGNCADWLAVKLFEGRAVAVGARAPNGWIVTDEMMDHVNQYLGALDCGAVQVNTSFEGVGWDVRGRADHVVSRPTMLTIDDLKYGHRLVSPEWNWTLIAHAVGYCIREQIQPERITLRIHQPRAYHPDGPLRSWSLSYADLMDCYRRIDARLSYPTAELSTSVEVCAKCHALPTCPAARQASMNAIDAAIMGYDDNLPNESVAYEMEVLSRALATIENRRDALNELILHRVRNGQQITYNGRSAQLKQRLGQRAWVKGMSGKMLTALTGVDLVRDGAVTPAEAERRGVDKSVTEALTHRPTIGTKLEWVDIDAQAKKVFGDGM